MALAGAGTLTGGAYSEGRVAGYVFKLIRESLRHTQSRLAEELGVAVATVQGWESGRRPLMAISAGQFLALQAILRRLGASSSALEALGLGVEADLFIGEALNTQHAAVDPTRHLLSSWVITRPFTEIIAWLVSGKEPNNLADLRGRNTRRGPVAARPTLSIDECGHVLTHIRTVAERADRTSPRGQLLARQAYYLLGFDGEPETAQWLTDMYRNDRRLVPPRRGWSESWPLARSTASALTRLGDPEPMRRFISERLTDQAGEVANLNYWAFWVGDLIGHQSSDAFIQTTPVDSWHGAQLTRHLLDRLHGNIGFLELNIHTLWSLIQIRPDIIRDPATANELAEKIAQLLDENLVSTETRRELEALRFGVAVAARR
ncbi:helix-turn-helix domain-containing protein [Thermomonospora umbrina]|uniref:Helix-turn-helix protein n=1 Tax=Thermomonospora umbrina TaxID=111806 RepID=A0A3D9SSR7_9ACTN|nr:helix-turn-helix domain-containing protein [Thermomonospora umbrina]REE98992.1 helix-turn-helix protein [Thermomonospora umbrina]